MLYHSVKNITPIFCLDKSFLNTVKPAHNGQVRSQRKLTGRSRWPLGAAATYEFFMNKIKRKNAR